MNSLLEVASTLATAPDPAWGFGLGGATFILSVPATWASLHLRGKTHGRLKKPVDIAYAGLTDRAVDTLQVLQTHLNEVLPDPTLAFNPSDVVVDPSSVEKSAKRGIRALKERHRIYRQFRTILAICSVLKYVAFAFTLMVLASTLMYFFANSSPSLWQTWSWITACLGLLAMGLVILYGVFETRIQSSIEHADPIVEKDQPSE